MKNFENPTLEVVWFVVEDVVTTSGGGSEDWSGDIGGGIG